MKKKLRIGIIGAGGIAGAHIKGYQSDDRAEIIGFYDTNLEAAKKRAGETGCKTFSTLDEMFRAGLDGVSICTPPGTHKELSIQALNAGLHVLCEKPFSTSARDSLEMCRVAKKMKKKLLVGLKFRVELALNRARQILNDGGIGQPLFFRQWFSGNCDMSGRWFSQKQLSGGGPLMDNGAHGLDLVCFLFGRPRKVVATVRNVASSFDVEDTAQVDLQMENGVRGNGVYAWTTGGGPEYHTEIFGTKGAIFLWVGKVFWRTLEHPEMIIEDCPNDPIIREVGHFLDCMEDPSRPCLLDGSIGYYNNLLIDAAYESARQDGEAITLKGEAL